MALIRDIVSPCVRGCVNSVTDRYAVDSALLYYLIITDGTDAVRKGMRDGDYVVDAKITDLAFAGVEGDDWENVRTTTITGATEYRDGIDDDGNCVVQGLVGETWINE